MRALLLSAALLVAACGESEDSETMADSTLQLSAMDSASADPASDRPAPLTVRSLLGTWDGEIRPIDRDTVLVTLQLVGTGDPPTFRLVLPNREPIPLEVSVAGDSIMTVSPLYQSVLRPGDEVATSGLFRLVNGRMEGTVTAHYRGSTAADSVVQLRSVFTRAP